MEQDTVFCGWIKEVPYVYADLDILALTSLNEGTPVSIIESMAAGVPVIATDAGGVKDLLGMHRSLSDKEAFVICERGILCRKNDAQGFAKGLAYLVHEEPEIRRKRIENARQYVREHFDRQRLFRDTEALYLELMGKRKMNKAGKLTGQTTFSPSSL
ncbi:MAG: glycosyltransferase family 4 protein [Desulfobacterales bacterium]